MADRTTVTVDAEGSTEDLELPTDLVELYREEPGETDAQIAADMLVMAFAERVHALAHHSEDAEELGDIEAIEGEMMAVFEDRFGMTYGEATGHSH